MNKSPFWVVLVLFLLQLTSCSKTEKDMVIEKIKASKVDSSQFSPAFYAHFEGTWDEKNEAILDLNSNGKKTKGYLTLIGDSNTVYMLSGTSDTKGNLFFYLFNLHQELIGILKGLKEKDKLYLVRDSTFSMFVNLTENYQNSIKFSSISKKDTIYAKNGQEDPHFLLNIHYLFPSENKESSNMLKDTVGDLFFKGFRMNSFNKDDVKASIDSAFALTTGNYLKKTAEIKDWNEKEILNFTWDRGIQTEIVYNRNNLVQYYFETHELKGESEWQAGFYKVYDIAEKRQLHLSDIVSDMDGLSKLIGKRMKPINGNDNPVEPVDNFYLNEAGLTFIYNPGNIRMEGVVYLFMPYKECKPFLKRSLSVGKPS
jgi:hypothetical protein